MNPEPLAVIRIRLADAAPLFVAAALDLLLEVEQADRVLVTDAVLARAGALRDVVDAQGW